MHYLIRALLAAIISSIIGWLAIVMANIIFSLTLGHQPPANSDFTIINWTVSLILSGIVFIIAYIKLTNWLGE